MRVNNYYDPMNHFGDNGYTRDFQGNILPKNSELIDALGDLDELIAYLGLIRYTSSEHKKTIFLIQKQLSCFASILANFPTNNRYISTTDLDNYIQQLTVATPHSKQFYIPGDREIPVFINICRTIARRTERTINKLDTPPPEITQFLNRLSSYLFALQMYYHYQ